MNRKNEEILRILVKESWKMELLISRAKWSFKKVLGVFAEFFSGWKLWHESTELLRSLENFWGFLVDFWSV
jgi:hypothetical protein